MLELLVCMIYEGYNKKFLILCRDCSIIDIAHEHMSLALCMIVRIELGCFIAVSSDILRPTLRPMVPIENYGDVHDLG